MSERTKKKASKKPVVVNKQFMLDLARQIYDGKNKRFLRLCTGTLQNGPDPTDKDRSMHCGIGELYFAMTGEQPASGNVTEDGVIDMAVRLSTLGPSLERNELCRKIRELGLRGDIVRRLIDALADADEDLPFVSYGNPEQAITQAEYEFRHALGSIPNTNDAGSNGCDNHGNCSTKEQFRKRSKRVATQFRKAAGFLPK